MDSGVTWVQETALGQHYWGQVASSADGNKLAGVDPGLSYAYIWVNNGGGWTNSGDLDGGTPQQFNSVVYSSDGKRLIVGGQMDYIYISTDGGGTWTKSMGAGAGAFTFACSSNGMRIIAADNQNYTAGYIYTSYDGGATWTQRPSAGLRCWRGIACTLDGMNIVAGVNGGFLYTSADGGITWIERQGAGTVTCLAAVIYR